MPRHSISRLTLSVILLGAATPALGQSLDPRSYVNTPVGMNFVVGSYSYQSGSVLFDPSVPITNANLTIQGPVAGFARALDFWGLSGKTSEAIGWQCLNGTGEVGTASRTRNVCGFSDPLVQLSVNFLGAPALTMRQFPTYHQKWLVGASLRVTAPLGQYDADRLVNIGTHRWSFTPQLGVSRAAGRLILEFLGGAIIYTTNGDFFGGHVLDVSPLYSGQINVIYTFKSGIWGGLGGTLYGGGAATIDGGPPSERQENTRAGAVLVFPIGKQNSLKILGTTGVSTRTGTDFDQVVVTWQYRWGGKK
jgi:outer membrane putative beta-barrel porin/alpha-amylase